MAPAAKAASPNANSGGVMQGSLEYRSPETDQNGRTRRLTMTTPSSNSRQNHAERMADLLEVEGIDAIFGIGDVCYEKLMGVWTDRGHRWFGPRHESAGAWMADARARLTGRPQVVIAGEGPGVANLLPACVTASKENIPLVFIGAQRERKFDAAVLRGQFQYMPQSKFFAPACKFVGIVEFPEQIDDVLREAFRQATTGRPGPVYVELPRDYQYQDYEFGPLERPDRYRLMRQPAADALVDQAVDLLLAAESPIVLVGQGVRNARAGEEFRKFAELAGCPVIQSYAAMATLPDPHPQLLPYSTPPANEAIAEADLVLAIGTSIGEPIHYGRTNHWAKGRVDRKWILVERDPTAVGVNRPIDLGIIGDVREVLPQLHARLEARGGREPSRKLPAWKKNLLELVQQLRGSAPDAYPIHPGRLMVEARKAIPEDAVIVGDGGCTSLWEFFYNVRTTTDYLRAIHFGMLGVGLPYAIGAKATVGDRPVALITGDSAFGFHIMEFEVAVRYDLPIVCIVNYDQHWGMEMPGHKATLGRYVDLQHAFVRLDKMAEAMGGHGEFVQQTHEIAPAIERAFASRRPAIVQVLVDPEVNAHEAPNWAEFVTWYGIGVEGSFREGYAGY